MTHPPLAERIAIYQEKERRRWQKVALFFLLFAGAGALASYLFLAIKTDRLPAPLLALFEWRQTPSPDFSMPGEQGRADLPEEGAPASPASPAEEETSPPEPRNEREGISVHLLRGTSDETNFRELAEGLTALGYQVETGKAQYDSYTVLNLGLKKGEEVAGKLLRQDLEKIFPQVKIDDLPDLAETSEFNVVIIVGKF